MTCIYFTLFTRRRGRCPGVQSWFPNVVIQLRWKAYNNYNYMDTSYAIVIIHHGGSPTNYKYMETRLYVGVSLIITLY